MRTFTVSAVVVLTGLISHGAGILTLPAHESRVGAADAQELRPVRNPHGPWIFQATRTESCADCHDMGAARRGSVPVLDNPAVRNLIDMGRGAHRGRFADCFRCHPGGTQRGRR